MRNSPFGLIGALCIALVVSLFAPPGYAVDSNLKNIYSIESSTGPAKLTAAPGVSHNESEKADNAAVVKVNVCVLESKELCVEFLTAATGENCLTRTKVPLNPDLGLSPPLLQNYARIAWNTLTKENPALAKHSAEIDKLLDPVACGACLTPAKIILPEPERADTSKLNTCANCSGYANVTHENGYTYWRNAKGDKLLLTTCALGNCK